MKRFASTLILAAAAIAMVCTIPRFVLAQAAPAKTSYKIGVVHRKVVFDKYKALEQRQNVLQAEVEKINKDLDNREVSIKAARKDYYDNKAKWTPEKITEVELKINNDSLKWQSDFRLLQADIDQKTEALVKQAGSEIDAVVAKVGKEKGFDLIFEGDLRTRTTVEFSAASIDITEAVVAQLGR